MSTTLSARSPILWLASATLAAAAVGGAYSARHPSATVTMASPHPEAVVPNPLDGEPPIAALAAPPASHESPRPADIDAPVWQRMLESVHNHPQRDRELNRQVGNLRFKRDLDTWAALKAQPNALERAQIGQRILDALPVRFANQEVTGPEALKIQSAIYADMIPDADQRRPMEEAARQALMRALEHDAAMAAKLRAEDAPMADFKEREAVILKRFRDQLIDQSQMERELDAARKASFK